MKPGRPGGFVRCWIHALASWIPHRVRGRGAFPSTEPEPAKLPAARTAARHPALDEQWLRSSVRMRTCDIRAFMLAELGDAGAASFPAITRRISVAADAQDLWYLRGELMSALSFIHGEAQAQEKVASITSRFKGLLPQGLLSPRSSRPRA